MIEANPHAPIGPSGGLNARFREAMDAVPAMICVAGQDKLRSWFNKPWLAFTGRTMAQELGNGWAEGVYPEDLNRCLEIYVGCFDRREGFSVQYRLRRSDEQYRWINDVGIPRYARNGSFLGYISSCTDVHDQKEAEAGLRELNEGLEQRIEGATTFLKTAIAAHSQTAQELLHSSGQLGMMIQGIKDCAIYMLDVDGHVISWNSGAERINGYTADEIVGEHFSSFFAEADRQADAPLRALRQAAIEGRFEGEGWRVRKDGSQFWANVAIDPIHDKDGRLIGFAKLTRDVTEKRKAQELLDRAREQIFHMQKMEAIGELTGGVAHDFNNLLNVVGINARLLSRKVRDPDDREGIELIRAAAERGSKLIAQLMAFSRKQRLEPRAVNLNEELEAMSDLLNFALGGTVQRKTNLAQHLWLALVDPTQIELVVLNLALNARDAMQSGGTLAIETFNAVVDSEPSRPEEASPGDYVCLAVSDTGAGIPSDILPRVLEPFFTTKGPGRGSGLGLSQVFGFAKQSGGGMRIETRIGQGTSVKVFLPRADVAVEDHEREP